jgi:hypothetical protein
MTEKAAIPPKSEWRKYVVRAEFGNRVSRVVLAPNDSYAEKVVRDLLDQGALLASDEDYDTSFCEIESEDADPRETATLEFAPTTGD